MKLVPLLLGDHRLQQLMRLSGGYLGIDQSQASGNSIDMGVHGKGWFPQGEKKHAGRRLGPHSGEFFQPCFSLRERKTG